MSETDLQLLTRYTNQRAEDAFAEIVRRHVDLVHSAALRQVRSPELAEEVAQAAFIELSRRAGQLPSDTVVGAWLYNQTRRRAIDVVRREAGRRLREQTAQELQAMNATAEDWTHIEPLLDDAMHALDETDRVAVLLRYFQNKPLHEVGQAMGVTDDAAQKRVSRAVERLRELIAKRGVAVGGSGLVILISTNAVLVAPPGVSAAIITTALTGTTFITTTTATVGKAIAMTTTQKVFITVALAAAVGTGIYEAREASTLRSQVQTLQQQLTRERDDPARQFAATTAAVPMQSGQVRTDNTELLRLRNEIGLLRGQVASLKAGRIESTPVQRASATDPVQVHDEEMRQLGLAASGGDLTALKKLEELGQVATKRNIANKGLTNVNDDTHRELRIAFKVMGEEAGKGSDTALQALWQATRMDYLQGMAIYALGDAAAMGNEQALEPLLDPKRYLMNNSSTTGALVPAAENGNVRAIEYLATVANDPNKQGEWGIVITGLKKPAAAGNATAIDALAVMGGSENASRGPALLALENAAFNKQPRAIEALRVLGYK